jgi:predicted dehydrogenase
MAKFGRRDFLKAGSIATAGPFLVGNARTYMLAEVQGGPAKSVAANDHIQIALIGAGDQGQYDTKVALEVPGVKVMAVADCYNGCLDHCKEMWGNDIQATRDYGEILVRKDIDAVIIATPDHWHMQATVDAMNAGKDVYCEKPMIHVYSDGPKIIEAAGRTNRIVQIGSQPVSSAVSKKAKELLAGGAIGQLNMVTAWCDRNSAMGAWEYTVPPDASPETCDWPRFLGTAPRIPFNAEHFFQWRKWNAYGSGVAGDLWVHLFSQVHFITGSNGPSRAMATGGLRFWKDGRDAPDVVLGLYDYPQGFNLSVRTNFVDGGSESFGVEFTGSEGRMTVGEDTLSLTLVPRETEPGLHSDPFSGAIQKRMLEEYRKKYPTRHPAGETLLSGEKYVAPHGYNEDYVHVKNFIDAVRTRQPVVEDAAFGFRAAGAALLGNVSYDRAAVVGWDPEAMELL